MARHVQATDVMREYDISVYGRLRQRPTGPLFYIRTIIVATGLNHARLLLHEWYQDVRDVRVLRWRDAGSQDWTYPNQEADK